MQTERLDNTIVLSASCDLVTSLIRNVMGTFVGDSVLGESLNEEKLHHYVLGTISNVTIEMQSLTGGSHAN